MLFPEFSCCLHIARATSALPSRTGLFYGRRIAMTDATLIAPSADHDALLTDEDVVARYRGRITIGTLRNWRALRIGPPYVKVGKAVLYSRAALQAWDRRNTVTCSKF